MARLLDESHTTTLRPLPARVGADPAQVGVSSTAVNSAAVNRWEQIRRKSVEVHADDARRQPLLPGARRGPSTTHDLISAALSQNIRSMTTRASAGGMHVK